MITSKEAANIFISKYLLSLYKNTYKVIESQLAEGFPGGVEEPYEMEKWYKNLDDDSKGLINDLLQATVKITIFEVLVLLDNMTGGYPIKGQVSDFALYLQTYADVEAKRINQLREAVRFNSLQDEELHDLFQFTLNNNPD
jgi:hypothetical protein